MKSILIFSALVLMVAGTAFANPGGAPAAHGVDGKAFGSAVSNAATSSPGAVANHVSKAGGNGGGQPAAHGVDGKDFGKAVSGTAKGSPGAVSDHVNGK